MTDENPYDLPEPPPVRDLLADLAGTLPRESAVLLRDLTRLTPPDDDDDEREIR